MRAYRYCNACMARAKKLCDTMKMFGATKNSVQDRDTMPSRRKSSEWTKSSTPSERKSKRWNVNASSSSISTNSSKSTHMDADRYPLTPCTRPASALHPSHSLEQVPTFESKPPERPRVPCRSSDVSRKRNADVKNINSRCRPATEMRSRISGAAQKTRCFVNGPHMVDPRMPRLHLQVRGDEVCLVFSLFGYPFGSERVCSVITLLFRKN